MTLCCEELSSNFHDVNQLKCCEQWHNFALIAYALVLNLPPVLVLHVILLPLNGWRLAQAFQDRHRTREISKHSWDTGPFISRA
jgi:hypothetical protein